MIIMYLKTIKSGFRMATLEIAEDNTTTEVMDHHGLVAAACRDLDITKRINQCIGSNDPRRVIQPGVAVMAMIINGLGFTNRRLYLTPQFFQSKAIGQLFEENIVAEQLDDHTLGKTLDEIYAYGTSRLYSEIAFGIALDHGLLSKFAHLDSTSFALQGQYNDTEPQGIEVRHGYSKDHRPDLKQVMLSMATSGSADIPFWMEPHNGNSSDKKTFTETIKRVRDFQSALKQGDEFTWVADSALYNKDKLLSSNMYHWVSQVPETLSEVKGLLSQPDDSFDWTTLDTGYKYSSHASYYGDIEQHWLIISSEQAYQREKKTFEKKLTRQEEELKKACWRLGNKIFSCEEDAFSAGEQCAKRYRYHRIDLYVTPVFKNPGRGRPKSEVEKVLAGYKIQSTITRNQKVIEQELHRKGRFIIATNNLDKNTLSDEALFAAYKEQQGVERGFRFLKDPWFMVDSFFVKKRQRIEALMMVMTLCLLVYNYAQHKLRKSLKLANETLPNQLGKPVKNPTMRWIFQLMEGIAIVKLYNPAEKSFRAMITNLNDTRIKIIRLLGKTACLIYGIQMEIAGM